MSQQLPYEFREQGDGYRFETDTGVFYKVEFTEASFFFSDFPAYISIFEFNISVVTLGENLTPPLDRRVEATIVRILENFLSNHENSIIYICESLDNRQKARHRKFSIWFNQNMDALPDLEKHDAFIAYENSEIFSSLIVHRRNPNKDTLINIFFEQVGDFNKS